MRKMKEMRCRHCGGVITDDMDFCGNCGNRILPEDRYPQMEPEEDFSQDFPANEASPNPNSGKPPKKGPGKIIAIVAGVLGLAAVIVVLLLVVVPRFGDDKQEDTQAVEEASSGSTHKKRLQDDSVQEPETTKEPETVEEETSGSEDGEPLENPDQVMAELRETEPVVTDQEELLMKMGNCLLRSDILEKDASYELENLTGEDQASLNYRIIRAAAEGTLESPYFPSNTTRFEKPDLGILLFSFYGCTGEPSWDSTLFTEYDDEVEIIMADGDPWILMDQCEIRENEDCYLLSAPAFYGDNGGTENIFVYYVDILFRKNIESCFGVIMPYVETHSSRPVISSADASSVLAPYKNKTYGADHLYDDNLTTPWVENASGTGAGESVTLHLDTAQKVYGLLLYNGYLESQYLFDINGKVTRVQVDFGDGNPVTMDVPVPYVYDDSALSEEYFAPCKIEAASPVVTDTITVTILDATSGSKYKDTCISEMRVY